MWAMFEICTLHLKHHHSHQPLHLSKQHKHLFRQDNTMRMTERGKHAQSSNSWQVFLLCVCVCVCRAYATQSAFGVTYSVVILVSAALWSRTGVRRRDKEKPLWLSTFCDYTAMMEGRAAITESHKAENKTLKWQGGMRTEWKSAAFRRKERSSGDRAVRHGGHMPHIICLPDCQPDLILFNHNALYGGMHMHMHTHSHISCKK